MGMEILGFYVIDVSQLRILMSVETIAANRHGHEMNHVTNNASCK